MALIKSFYRNHGFLGIVLVLAGGWTRAAPPCGSFPCERQELASGPSTTSSLNFDEPPADLAFIVDRPLKPAELGTATNETETKPTRSLQNKIAGWWGSWTTQVVVRDPGEGWEEPMPTTGWRTDETVRLELAGPLFAFTQVGAGCDCMAAQELTVIGRTGLGWKLSPSVDSELLVRGGPVLTCSDPLLPERVQEHSEFKVEVEYRCPLAGPLRLEYQGAATPAFRAIEHPRLNQDLGFAIPLGSAGQFRLGAKHDWQSFRPPLPWTAGMEFYVGLKLGR